MKPTFPRLRFLAVFCLLGVFVTPAQPQVGQSKDEIHVLFIGNSLTYVNDLPKMVAELAKAGKQRPLRYERETPGGCTLEKHWKDGKALAKIRSRKWDFVVLQDHSQGALQKRDAMFEYGRKLDSEIKKNGAKTILYLTWALQNKPNVQPTISKAYLDLSKELKAQVAPVGIAWAMALQADKKLVLHQTLHFLSSFLLRSRAGPRGPTGPGFFAGSPRAPLRLEILLRDTYGARRCACPHAMAYDPCHPMGSAAYPLTL
jgi:hypothetical protein